LRKLVIPTPSSLSSLVFLEPYEKPHAARGASAIVAELLGCQPPSSTSGHEEEKDGPNDAVIQKGAGVLGMDSQAKYGCLAWDKGSVYMRLPVAGFGNEKGYREKIWVCLINF
jgi:hypothetical protein